MFGLVSEVNVAAPGPIQESAQMSEEEEEKEQSNGRGDAHCEHTARPLHGHRSDTGPRPVCRLGYLAQFRCCPRGNAFFLSRFGYVRVPGTGSAHVIFTHVNVSREIERACAFSAPLSSAYEKYTKRPIRLL